MILPRVDEAAESAMVGIIVVLVKDLPPYEPADSAADEHIRRKMPASGNSRRCHSRGHAVGEDLD